MATSAMPPGAPFARLDEVKRLQAQVDQMQERLDFISPIMPLVNFCQDYFQKVECEASVQLMRLKNAHVMQAKTDSAEEEMSNAQLETVKWLHLMTDAIMGAHSGAAGGTLTALPTPAASPQQQLSAPRDFGGGGGGYQGGNSPGLGSAFPSLGGGNMEDSRARQTRMDLEAETKQRLFGAAQERRFSSGSQPSAMVSPGQPMRPYNPTSSVGSNFADNYPQNLETPPREVQPGSIGRDRSGQLSQAQRSSDDMRSRPDSILSSMTPGGPSSGGSALGSLGLAANAAAAAKANPVSSGGPLRYLSEIGTEEPLAEPGTGGTNERFQLDSLSMSGSGGLIMGRGSWATAYRQASGHRREALRLLCTSGIVTARELSDDLTVISEEHIEECVQIATEMLQTWTLEMWARQPQEAKKFFEARLTALYQRKFGEQKGP